MLANVRVQQMDQQMSSLAITARPLDRRCSQTCLAPLAQPWAICRDVRARVEPLSTILQMLHAIVWPAFFKIGFKSSMRPSGSHHVSARPNRRGKKFSKLWTEKYQQAGLAFELQNSRSVVVFRGVKYKEFRSCINWVSVTQGVQNATARVSASVRDPLASWVGQEMRRNGGAGREVVSAAVRLAFLWRCCQGEPVLFWLLFCLGSKIATTGTKIAKSICEAGRISEIS